VKHFYIQKDALYVEEYSIKKLYIRLKQKFISESVYSF